MTMSIRPHWLPLNIINMSQAEINSFKTYVPENVPSVILTNMQHGPLEIRVPPKYYLWTLARNVKC